MKISTLRLWEEHSEIGIPQAVLETCRSSHSLISVSPLSIAEIEGMFPDFFLRKENIWLAHQRRQKGCLVHRKGKPRWSLLQKHGEVVSGSVGLPLRDHQGLLRSRYEPVGKKLFELKEAIPTLREAISLWLVHYFTTGIPLWSEVAARTASVDENGFCICIGSDEERMFFFPLPEQSRGKRIGCAGKLVVGGA